MESNKNLVCTKLFLFDLDGTLIKLDFNAEGTRKKLHDFVYNKYKKEVYFKPVLKKIDELSNKLKDKKLKNDLLAILTEEELKSIENSKPLIPPPLIKKLKDQEKKIGIVSRTSKEAVLLALKKHNFPEFDVIISREDTDETKPSAKPITYALKKLGIKPEESVLIGDHPYDMISGKKAGVKTIAIITKEVNEEDLKDADYKLDDINQLYNLLK